MREKTKMLLMFHCIVATGTLMTLWVRINHTSIIKKNSFRQMRVLSAQMIMSGQHYCPWVRIGCLEICNKRCINDYCHNHRRELRKGRKSPVPCRRCGKGTGSITLLCQSCGAHRIAQGLINTGIRTHRNFEHVVLELIDVV